MDSGSFALIIRSHTGRDLYAAGCDRRVATPWQFVYALDDPYSRRQSHVRGRTGPPRSHLYDLERVGDGRYRQRG
jgi:hypothetical protein